MPTSSPARAGLLICASEAADASGFVGFNRESSGEAAAFKGMLWAKWGGLGVINTHMTFEYADGGAQRRKQQAALATLAARLLGLALPDESSTAGSFASSAVCDPSCGIDRIADSGCGCDAVLITGDFNHALPEQCTAGAAGVPPPIASPYTRPWLPADASLAFLLSALRLGGLATVERLSSDVPTNEDGTLDHVFVVTRATQAQGYSAVHASAVADDAAEVSDHLMIKSVVRLCPRTGAYESEARA